MNFGSLGQRWATLTRNQQIAMIVVGALLLYGLVAGVLGGSSLLSVPRLLAVATIIFVALPFHEYAHAAAAVANRPKAAVSVGTAGWSCRELRDISRRERNFVRPNLFQHAF